ncbi:MAG: tRNA lysidine(34) synthetase TilS, partial [Casimicrobiaceae bacterium]
QAWLVVSAAETDPSVSNATLPQELSAPGTWRTTQGELRVSFVPPGQRPEGLKLLAPPKKHNRAGWLLRLRLPGDRIRLTDRSGHVLLKNVFQAHAVAPWQRAHWPLLCDGERVIAVVGLAMDDRYTDPGGFLLQWNPVSSPMQRPTLPDGAAEVSDASRVNPAGG